MTARRALAAALLATAALAARPRQQADPHELFDQAVQQLEQGRLEDSVASAARLRELVTSKPRWDPEGSFRRDLLPPLEARQKRLQGAARALDQFHDRTLQELHPPDLSSEISTVKDYTHWATTVVQRLRTERDELVQKVCPDPADVAVLARTDAWARTERLLEVEVLKTMAEKAGDDVLGLLSGDPQLESVLARFRQLKKDLIETMAERDQLKARIDEAESRRQALAAAVASAVLEEGGSSRGRRDEAAGAQARFVRLLKSEKEALEKRASVTPAERAALEGRVDRLRLANSVLTAAGIIRDQRRGVEEVAGALAAIKVKSGPPAPAPGFRWMVWILAALLGATAGFGAQLVLRDRLRTAAASPRPAAVADLTLPGTTGGTHQEGADDHRHAA